MTTPIHKNLKFVCNAVYEKLADLSGLSIAEITKEAEENGLLTLDMVVLKL